MIVLHETHTHSSSAGNHDEDQCMSFLVDSAAAEGEGVSIDLAVSIVAGDGTSNKRNIASALNSARSALSDLGNSAAAENVRLVMTAFSKTVSEDLRLFGTDSSSTRSLAKRLVSILGADKSECASAHSELSMLIAHLVSARRSNARAVLIMEPSAQMCPLGFSLIQAAMARATEYDTNWKLLHVGSGSQLGGMIIRSEYAYTLAKDLVAEKPADILGFIAKRHEEVRSATFSPFLGRIVGGAFTYKHTLVATAQSGQCGSQLQLMKKFNDRSFQGSECLHNVLYPCIGGEYEAYLHYGDKAKSFMRPSGIFSIDSPVTTFFAKVGETCSDACKRISSAKEHYGCDKSSLLDVSSCGYLPRQILRTEKKENVQLICMSNPKRLNAWTIPMLETIFAELDAAQDDDDVHAVVLAGECHHDYYCAGADLGGLLKPMAPRKLVDTVRKSNEALFNKFLEFPKPIVCAVNGHAIGASVTSAALCDGIVAMEGSSFSTPFHRLGIAAEGCSTVNFPRIMGSENAERMLGAEGWRPTGDEAHTMGLVDVLVRESERDLLHDHAIELAKEIITVDGGKRKLEKLGLVAEYKKVNEEESVALGKSLLSKEFFDNQYAMASKKGKSSSKMFWLLSKVQPLLARSL
eukprot:g2520.t1